MKMEITGKRFGNFTDRNGKAVVFRILYVKSTLRSTNGIECDGYTTEKIGVTRCLTEDDMRVLSVGDVIDVTFNQYGGVEGVEIC